MNRQSTKTILLFAIVLLTSCADDDNEQEPCNPAHRMGTYYFTAIETAGDCGPIDAQVVYVTSAAALDPGCELLAPDQFSADQCTLTRTYVCDLGDGLFAEYTGWTAEYDGGDLFEGQSSLDVYDDTDILCSSVYSLEYTRQ